MLLNPIAEHLILNVRGPLTKHETEVHSQIASVLTYPRQMYKQTVMRYWFQTALARSELYRPFYL